MKQVILQKADLDIFAKKAKSLILKEVKNTVYANTILVQVTEGFAKLVSSNGETQISMNVGCESESSFDFLLPLKDLKKSFRFLGEDLVFNLDFDAKKGYLNDSSFVFDLADTEAFRLLELGEKTGDIIQIDDMLAFNKVLPTMLRGDIRSFICCCLVEQDKEKEEIRLITTNGHSLSYVVNKSNTAYNRDLSVMLPESFCNVFADNTIVSYVGYGTPVIMLHLYQDDMVLANINVKVTRTSKVNLNVITKQVGGRFPAYQRVTNQVKNPNIDIDFNVDTYYNAIGLFDSLNSMSKKSYPWLKFVLDNETKLLLSDIKDNQLEIEIKNNSNSRIDNELNLGYTQEYLKDVAKLAKLMKLKTIKLEGNSDVISPAMFSLGDNFKYYLMPNKCRKS